MKETGKGGVYIQPEVVAQARKVDLLTYLQATQPQELVRCDGNEYCTRSHDSLKISNGKWFWWSRGIGGTSALDYLVKVQGLDFLTAVEAVLGKAVAMPTASAPTRKKYDRLYLPAYTFACDRAKEYLLGRGIDEAIIDGCIAGRLIAQDRKTGAVMFLGYDEQGKLRHCCSRSVDGNGKKDMAGSDKRYALRLVGNGEDSTVRVFESAIDLLSFATLLKKTGRDHQTQNLISLSGIYLPRGNFTKIPLPLDHYLKTHPNTNRICLCLDNDFAGRRGAEALQATLGGKYTVEYFPPPAGKDYNDYLKKKEGKKFEAENQER